DGGGVELRDASGVARAHYTDLFAHDASGAALPSEMTAHDGTIALRVDASSARFPVTIDPLTWSQQAKLTATDSKFRQSVAIQGDTAIVGAPGANIGGQSPDQGAVYVFTRSAGAWSLQQKLVASDGGWGNNFGCTVGLDGEQAIVGAYKGGFSGADTVPGSA